ncbi:MAG: TonB-dependent receptor [Bacteroidota bacterium]
MFISCTQLAIAQDKTVSGTVTDGADGTGLPGVNILEKGTTNGTVTDFDGNFRLTVSENATIVISFVGYEAQEIEVGNRSVIDVQLATDVKQLSEVVVVGYGVQEKRDVTGALSSIGEEDFNPGVINNPGDLIRGKLAGVQVTPSSGAPGAGLQFQVRGNSSLRSNNDPLIVVDGVPLDGRNIQAGGADAFGTGGGQANSPLNFLNPDDIEQIDVLKDASAAAIYGTRGSNGVVLITTKSGKAGAPKVTYSTFGSASFLRQEIDVLNAEQYTAALNSLQATGELSEELVNNSLRGGNTNWQDEIYETALSHNHALSYSGGDEDTRYSVSVSAFDQAGILRNTGQERYTARVKASQKALNDKLDINVNVTYSHLKDQGAFIGDRTGFEGDVIALALVTNPTTPVFNEDGSFFTLNNSIRNPREITDNFSDRTLTDRALGNISLEYEFIGGLKYKVNFGFDRSQSVRRTSFPTTLSFTPNGRADINSRENSNFLIEHLVNYSRDIGEGEFSALVGYTFQEFLNRGSRLASIGGFQNTSNTVLPTNAVLGPNPVEGGTVVEVGSDAEVNSLQSFLGRVNYVYRDKYIVTANVRVDGSTRFGENNRYAVFPSFALGWRLSDEAFISDLGIFDNLKLRYGWGQTGNQEFENGISQPVFRLNANTGALEVQRQPNPDIQWETTTQNNIGVDFGLFNGRLNGSIDAFRKVTTDLLLQIAQPAPSLVATGFENVDAELINRGIEVVLGGVVYDNENFSWNTDFNITFIDNEVENLTTGDIFTGDINGQGLSNVRSQIITNGESVGSFFLTPFVGFNEAGEPLYRTLEGGVTTSNDGSDRIIAGSAIPDFTWGITNSLSYKRWDFNFLISGVQGNEIYNNTANALFTRNALAQQRNTTVDNASEPEATNATLSASTRFLEDGSFVRLENVSLGYNFDVSNIEEISSLRLYVTGQNLVVLTNYTGYDPEVNTDKNVENVPSLGIDLTSYPRPSVVLVGLNISF